MFGSIRASAGAAVNHCGARSWSTMMTRMFGGALTPVPPVAAGGMPCAVVPAGCVAGRGSPPARVGRRRRRRLDLFGDRRERRPRPAVPRPPAVHPSGTCACRSVDQPFACKVRQSTFAGAKGRVKRRWDWRLRAEYPWYAGIPMQRTTVKLPDDLDARLRHEAHRQGITIAQVTRTALEAHLGGGRRRLGAAGVGAVGAATSLSVSRRSSARDAPSH